MKDTEIVVRTTNQFTQILSTALWESTPRTFEHEDHFERESMRDTHDKKARLLLWSFVILMVFAFSVRLEPWTSVHWAYLATSLLTVVIGYRFVSRNDSMVAFRINVTRSWVIDAAKAGLPSVPKPLRQSGDYEQTYKRFQEECSLVVGILQTKAEDIAKKRPLAHFREEMASFINLNEELKRRLNECYKLAETLNPDTQVHF